jgi:4'-phosphopantetheinyl transferase EntD
VTVLFSAKESVYKALRAQVGAFFEFHDVHATAVVPDGAGGGRVALRVARDLGPVPRGTTLEAAFAVDGDHVHTRVALRP